MAPLAPQNPFDDHKTWYLNENSGEIKHITNWFERQYYNSLGWYSRFPTRAQAEAYRAAHPPTHKNPFNPTNPTNPANKGLRAGAGAAADAAKDAVTGVTNDVLKPLFQGNIWIRVAEVALGVVLIAVGVARLTNALPVATKIAKAVA